MPDGINKANSVFLSYSHQETDRVVCNDLFDNLRLQDLDVKKDEHDLVAGENLQESIGKLIDSSDYSIVIISENSLQSAWVIWEIRKRLATPLTQLIPVYLDKSFLDDGFAKQVSLKLQADIEQLAKDICALNMKGIATAHLDEKKKNLFDFNHIFPEIIKHIRASNAIDLRPENYEQGFLSIYKAITGASNLKRPDIKLPLIKQADIESRREEIMELIRVDISEAARRTLDFTKLFHKNNVNLLTTALQISYKITAAPDFLTKEEVFTNYYKECIPEIMELIYTPPISNAS